MNVLDEIVQDQLRTDLPDSPRATPSRCRPRSSRATASASRSSRGPSCACAAAASPARSRSAGSPRGVGVERTFKINSPRIEKIEVVRHGVARRAQLYFLRDRVGKAATLRERRTNG